MTFIFPAIVSNLYDNHLSSLSVPVPACLPANSPRFAWIAAAVPSTVHISTLIMIFLLNAKAQCSCLVSRQRTACLFPVGVLDNLEGFTWLLALRLLGVYTSGIVYACFRASRSGFADTLRIGFLTDARYAGFKSQRAYMVLMSKHLDSFREGGGYF